MPKSALDIGAVFLLVLPGFLAYSFAIVRRADPAGRSPLWQLAEILKYSAYVHLVGVALTFCVTGLLGFLGIDTHLDDLPGMGPQEFLSSYFIEGALLFTLYPVYVVVGATLMGVYDFPSWTEGRIVHGASTLIKGVGLIPGLRWIPPPRSPYPQEPIWYHAFHVGTDGFAEVRPLLMIRMKGGDIYYGELASYPLLPDSQKEKDFLIAKARIYPGGDPEREHRLEDIDGGGTVLLNTSEVSSIEVYYDSPEESR